MNELQVVINQNPGKIDFNFDELKVQLSNKMAEYEGAVFTEESKQIARDELADLRKLKESVESRRKEVKNQFMVPYSEFEKRVKEITGLIDKPINLIDKQIKEMEENRIQKRKQDVSSLYKEAMETCDQLPELEAVYDKKWNLAGTSIKKIKDDINALVDKTISDIALLEHTMSDVTDEAVTMYKRDRDLTNALTFINNYESNKKKALEIEAERRRAEEERHIQQEIDRAKAEERQKLAEIERAREEERRKALEDVKAKTPISVPDHQTEVLPETPFTETDELDDLPFTQPSTVTAFYKVVATEEELQQVEMAFNSIGIYFERRTV